MKNTANLIKFLAAMLVLTLVARGTSAATLPFVDLGPPQASEIAETVSGSAVVMSAGQAEITAPEGLTVVEALAGVGQKLAMGDPVASFGMAELNDALDRQKAQLGSQRLQLEKLYRDEPVDATPVENAWRNLERAKNIAADAKANADALPGIGDAEKAVEDAKSDEKKAKKAYDSLPPDTSGAVKGETKKEKAEREKKEAEAKKEKDGAKKALDSASAALAAAQETLASARKAADDLKAANEKVEDASSALDKANADYAKAGQQSSDTERQNRIDASVVQLDIAKQEALVAELESLASYGGVLHATAAGVVTYILDAGSRTDGGAAARVMDSSAGSKAEMSIDMDDAARLSVGDECQVSSGSGMYYRASSTATVFAISAPDDRDMAKVTLLLPEGEWTRGQSLDAQAVINRASYGLCVPLSALHSDSSGYFVYTVSEKSTVLGIENVVLRIPVNLVARDDDNAAVEGPLGRDDDVVTGSSKNISEGSRVRIS